MLREIPDPLQIDAAADSGAPFIEIHTGRYADATTDADRNAEFKRIAAGAGVQVQEVNRLLTQFEQMQKMMKSMQKGGMAKMMRGMKGRFPGMG